jgi:hypothetical protein
MSFVDAALCYLLVFRLSIVAAGMLSLVLGYKLFLKGSETFAKSTAGTTIESSIGIGKFTVRNAAPGTAFALFGVCLLMITLVQGRPLVTLETLSQWQGKVGADESNETTGKEKIELRGSGGAIEQLTAEGVEFARKGDNANAQRAFEEAVTDMAEPMNDLAWIYLGSGHAKEALSLATVAVQLRPNEPRYLDTLAKVSSATK